MCFGSADRGVARCPPTGACLCCSAACTGGCRPGAGSGFCFCMVGRAGPGAGAGTFAASAPDIRLVRVPAGLLAFLGPVPAGGCGPSQKVESLSPAALVTSCSPLAFGSSRLRLLLMLLAPGWLLLAREGASAAVGLSTGPGTAGLGATTKAGRAAIAPDDGFAAAGTVALAASICLGCSTECSTNGLGTVGATGCGASTFCAAGCSATAAAAGLCSPAAAASVGIDRSIAGSCTKHCSFGQWRDLKKVNV